MSKNKNKKEVEKKADVILKSYELLHQVGIKLIKTKNGR